MNDMMPAHETNSGRQSAGAENARTLAGRKAQRLKILLTEGSSTSARQTLYALGRLGHTIDVCDPQRLCLGRFSRYVRRFYRCPLFTTEPLAYLRCLNDRLQVGQYDVLLPVHDQVYLLARVRDILSQRVGIALPEFEALAQVQSKSRFAKLLDSLGLPQPPTSVVRAPSELDYVSCEFPCYAKLAHSTAGRGVWLVRSREELRRLGNQLQRPAAAAEFPELVLQAETRGCYCVVATVFQHGRLLAAHAYRPRQTGVGGSAQARESVLHPAVCEDVARLGAHLRWHGAMHVEYFYDDTTDHPTYIEINPRIGETLNATLSGTNLCALLVQVSLGEVANVRSTSRAGVKTHSVMTSLLAAGERGDSRRSLLAEIARVWRGQGVYRGSEDELTRLREDYLSLLPFMFVAGRLIVRPASASKMIHTAVSHYSLTHEAVNRIDRLSTQELAACFS